MRIIKPTKRSPRRAAQRGFTLIEMMITISIMTVVMGALFSIATSIGDTAIIQNAEMTASGQVRGAMTTIMRELRETSRGNVIGPATELGAQSITYRKAADGVDANLLAVTSMCTPEYSDPFVIRRGDPDDGDQITNTQLVLVSSDGTVRVLANGLPAYEDANDDGILDAGEDLNGNGQLDRGIWFQYEQRRIQVTIESQGFTRQRQALVSRLTQSVFPRNS